MSTAANPTPEQLLQAWQERRRADWPPTFEAALADPIYSRLVRWQALHGSRPTTVRPAVQAPVPPPAHAPSQPWRAPRRKAWQPTVDRKRAASGERDDD